MAGVQFILTDTIRPAIYRKMSTWFLPIPMMRAQKELLFSFGHHLSRGWKIPKHRIFGREDVSNSFRNHDQCEKVEGTE